MTTRPVDRRAIRAASEPPLAKEICWDAARNRQSLLTSKCQSDGVPSRASSKSLVKELVLIAPKTSIARCVEAALTVRNDLVRGNEQFTDAFCDMAGVPSTARHCVKKD
jgi:hypothetical protein